MTRQREWETMEKWFLSNRVKTPAIVTISGSCLSINKILSANQKRQMIGMATSPEMRILRWRIIPTLLKFPVTFTKSLSQKRAAFRTLMWIQLEKVIDWRIWHDMTWHHIIPAPKAWEERVSLAVRSPLPIANPKTLQYVLKWKSLSQWKSNERNN